MVWNHIGWLMFLLVMDAFAMNNIPLSLTTQPLSIHLIYFKLTHEIKERDLCVLESYNRLPSHEGLTLHLWLLGDSSNSTNLTEYAQSLKLQVVLHPIQLSNLFDGTPFAKLYTPSILVEVEHFFSHHPNMPTNFGTLRDKLGKHWRINICNALRLAILYKYGGLYHDLDFFVLRDPRALPDGIGYQGEFFFSFILFFHSNFNLFIFSF